MQNKSFWWGLVALAIAVVLTAGCQFPGFRSAKRATSEPRNRPPNDKQVADVQLSLGRTLELRGEIEPALNAYRKAIENDPRRSTGYWRMALLQDRQGNVEESETLYRQALKVDPKNPDLLCDYGYSLYLRRRWAEAEDRLRQAIVLKPKHLRAHNNLGLVLAQAERPDEALTEFRKAGVDEADAHSNLAFVMTVNQRWDKAREHYESALEANPDSTVAKSGLERLNSVVAKLGAKLQANHACRPRTHRGGTAGEHGGVLNFSTGKAVILGTNHFDRFIHSTKNT